MKKWIAYFSNCLNTIFLYKKKGTENTIIVNANLDTHKIFQEYGHKKLLLWTQMLPIFSLA